MTFAWRQYTTDLGFIYPFIPFELKQLSEIPREGWISNIFLPSDNILLTKVKNSCPVPLLIYRSILISFDNGALYSINYPNPFSRGLVDHIANLEEVVSVDFIGETIKYHRIIKMVNRE